MGPTKGDVFSFKYAAAAPKPCPDIDAAKILKDLISKIWNINFPGFRISAHMLTIVFVLGLDQ